MSVVEPFSTPVGISNISKTMESFNFLKDYLSVDNLNKEESNDFKMYLTKSLINKGFLYQNTEVIKNKFKYSLEDIFSEEFKEIFLYDSNRDIQGIYTDIKSVKNMQIIGKYDIFSAMLGTKTTKLMDFNFIDNDTEDYIFEMISLTDKELLMKNPNSGEMVKPNYTEEELINIKRQFFVNKMDSFFKKNILKALDNMFYLLEYNDCNNYIKLISNKQNHDYRFNHVLERTFKHIQMVFRIMEYSILYHDIIEKYKPDVDDHWCSPYKFIKLFIESFLKEGCPEKFIREPELSYKYFSNFVKKVLVPNESDIAVSKFNIEDLTDNYQLTFADNYHKTKWLLSYYAYKKYNKKLTPSANLIETLNMTNDDKVFYLFLTVTQLVYQSFEFLNYMKQNKTSTKEFIKNYMWYEFANEIYFDKKCDEIILKYILTNRINSDLIYGGD